jgi:hypothetical protein
MVETILEVSFNHLYLAIQIPEDRKLPVKAT